MEMCSNRVSHPCMNNSSTSPIFFIKSIPCYRSIKPVLIAMAILEPTGTHGITLHILKSFSSTIRPTFEVILIR